jgi:hypothetical protein
MSISSRFLGLSAVLVLAVAMAVSVTAQERGRGQAAPLPPQTGHGMGSLVLWGDIALFEKPGTPNNCVLTNRYTRGQRIGFRMTAVDGGTGEPENTAQLTAHITVGGRTVDVPMRFRGGGGATVPNGYLRAPRELWTGFWLIPPDAPTGMVTYTVTAEDKFGRKATFTPFSYETSQIFITG